MAAMAASASQQVVLAGVTGSCGRRAVAELAHLVSFEAREGISSGSVPITQRLGPSLPRPEDGGCKGAGRENG